MGAYLAVPQACGRLAVVAMGGAGELEAAGVVAGSTRGGSFGSVLDMRSLRHATERSTMRCDEIRLRQDIFNRSGHTARSRQMEALPRSLRD